MALIKFHSSRAWELMLMGSIVVLENGVGFERMVSNLFVCTSFCLYCYDCLFLHVYDRN